MKLSTQDHATSRYMRVTVGAVDRLQQDYLAGRDLGHSIPGMSADEAAVIVSESLEADRILNHFFEIVSGKRPKLRSPSDWSRAVLAELLLGVADIARKARDRRQERDYWALGWATLEELLKTPTFSPMLDYEDIYFDVGQELRIVGEREAVSYFKRALAHSLYHDQGGNAETLLRDLAETYMWVDELDPGLRIYVGLLYNDPADIWTYNSMALTFGRFRLTDVGVEATRRSLELIEAKGDPYELHDQLSEALDEMQKSSKLPEQSGREGDVSPSVLANLRTALRLDFDAGEHLPILELCEELVPDLDSIPIKRQLATPNLPAPEQILQQRAEASPKGRTSQARQTRQAETSPRGRASQSRQPRRAEAAPKRRTSRAERLPQDEASPEKLGRNDPCWCGSGKKYKHCHWRRDRRGR
jgi:tetratricopeptide (TPR) repeat protein